LQNTKRMRGVMQKSKRGNPSIGREVRGQTRVSKGEGSPDKARKGGGETTETSRTRD